MAKSKFINVELDWAESKLAEWKKYIDDNPFHKMVDRMGVKTGPRGQEIEYVVSKIEDQQKSVRETTKDYFLLLKEIKTMREDKEEEVELKGGASTPHRMRDDTD